MGDRCGMGFLVLNFDPRFKKKPGKSTKQTEGEGHQGIVYAGQIGENNDL